MNRGIGFAIPINLAREVSDQLIRDGRFSRIWLGIHIESLSESKDYKKLVSTVKNGVVVRSVVRDGPVANSDLQPADIITAVDGKEVASAQDLKSAIRNKPVGKPLTLDVVRDDKRIKIKVKPGEMLEENSRNSPE